MYSYEGAGGYIDQISFQLYGNEEVNVDMEVDIYMGCKSSWSSYEDNNGNWIPYYDSASDYESIDNMNMVFSGRIQGTFKDWLPIDLDWNYESYGTIRLLVCVKSSNGNPTLLSSSGNHYISLWRSGSSETNNYSSFEGRYDRPNIKFHICQKKVVDNYSFLYDSDTKEASINSFSNYETKLETIEIPNSINIDGETYSVTKIYRFDSDSYIKKMTIPASVLYIASDALSSCYNMQELTIQATDKELRIGKNAFSSNISKFYMGRNIVMQSEQSSPFYYSSTYSSKSPNLVQVDVSDKVTFIADYLFYYCTKLSIINLPNTLKKIGNSTFLGCSNLTEVKLPSSLTSIGTYAFCDCPKLSKVNIPSSLTSIGQSAFYGCNLTGNIDIPFGVNAIPYGCFYGCNANFTIPSSVKSIGDYAFYNAPSIITINSSSIPQLGSSTFADKDIILVPKNSVQKYKEEWSQYKNRILGIGTTSMTINDAQAQNGMSILHSKIGEEHLSEIVTLKVAGTINSYDLMIMRNKMTNLRNLDLSDASIVANSYEYYQGYCSVENTLTKWSLPDDLLSIKLPKTLTNIGKESLCNLKNIAEIEIPASVTEIADNAANGLKNLKVLTFANNSQCTSIGEKAFYNCSALASISIPAKVTSIGLNAFNGCSSLKELTFEDGEETLSLKKSDYSNSFKINNHSYYSYNPFYGCNIRTLYIGRKMSYANSSYRLCLGNSYLQSVEFGEYASVIDAGQFAGCTNLKEVKGLENIKSIGEGAFYKCSSLESLTIPSNVTKIEPWAFKESGLKSMNIPAGVTSLGDYAFADCPNLEKFTFSEDCELTAIPNYFLYNAVKLDNIALPKNTLTIGNYAFYGCTLMKECKISSKITKIGDYAFNQCNNLNSVYAYTFEPQAIDQNTFSTYHTATLHIPSASYLLYFYDTQWSQFLHLVGFDSETEQIGINVDYHLYTETNGIIGGKPRVDIQGKGGLTIIGDKVQPFGDIHITANDMFFGSLVANGNITADKIFFDITVNKDKWYFFCFPFDIPLANITKQGSFKWAMYDGNARATKGTTGWKDLPSGTKMLLKGKGYIFRTNFEGELSLRVDNPTFDAVNEQTTLTSYVSTNEANANWNMVGNPYPCYYPINKLQYGAPIIVWNGKGYDAYRPGDDDYILHPFEAMFVQKPQMVSNVGFLAEWRQTYAGSHPVSSNAKPFGVDFAQSSEIAENSRRFINLTLSHGEQVDKTRIVFNEAQSVSYEQECDAAKFESFDSPQLYSMGADGVKFAINERPVDNGKIALGFYAPEEGMYTFSTTRMDVNAYIYDAKTTKTYDLSDGEFTFNAEQGTDNGRFTLIFADETTDISGVLTPNEGADKVYDLNGRKMNDAKTGIVIKNGKKVVVK